MADSNLARTVLQSIGGFSDAHVDPALGEAARAFLQTDPDLEQMKHWLHEARDYMVRYAWASGFVMQTVAIVIGEGRSRPPPPEEDDVLAWRKRWETRKEGPA